MILRELNKFILLELSVNFSIEKDDGKDTLFIHAGKKKLPLFRASPVKGKEGVYNFTPFGWTKGVEGFVASIDQAKKKVTSMFADWMEQATTGSSNWIGFTKALGIMEGDYIKFSSILKEKFL